MTAPLTKAEREELRRKHRPEDGVTPTAHLCVECANEYPCPVIRLLDELEAAEDATAVRICRSIGLDPHGAEDYETVKREAQVQVRSLERDLAAARGEAIVYQEKWGEARERIAELERALRERDGVVRQILDRHCHETYERLQRAAPQGVEASGESGAYAEASAIRADVFASFQALALPERFGVSGGEPWTQEGRKQLRQDYSAWPEVIAILDELERKLQIERGHVSFANAFALAQVSICRLEREKAEWVAQCGRLLDSLEKRENSLLVIASGDGPTSLAWAQDVARQGLWGGVRVHKGCSNAEPKP